MYGFKNATRMALRRLRKPKGVPPAQPAPLLPLVEVRPGIAPIQKAISVIIPTKNAGTDFQYLLKRLRAQEGIRGCEVILVDSGSTDDTIALAPREGTKVISISPTEFTHAFARNKGADAASGDYLLFMVQDALPLTNVWLWEMATSLQRNDLAAVSCAEYPRSDSDLFYQFLIHRQYDTPGLNHDRVLTWDESCSSYLGLRTNAQLCDIAALIRRDVFQQYRYRTAYAEDLDLGIRLIRDGHKLGFLHSTRVLHSHNRSAYYFLKRGYVDVRFLVNVFPNFVYPEVERKQWLYSDILILYTRIAEMAGMIKKLSFPLPLVDLVEQIRSMLLNAKNGGLRGQAIESELDDLMSHLAEEVDDVHSRAASKGMILPHLSGHLEDFQRWLCGIYGRADERVAGEIVGAIQKAFALHCGTHLAYFYLTCANRGCLDESLVELDRRLVAGV
jgi:glycosyltransferase involved in cell wall biosynthesis